MRDESKLAGLVLQFADMLAEKVAERLRELTPRSEPSPWLGIDAAARYAGVSPTSLRRAARDNRLRAARCGRKWKFHRDALDQFLSGQQESST